MSTSPEKRIKIAYLTHRNAQDKREWSGTLYHMAQSLQKHAGDVVYAGPYNPRLMFFFLKAVNKLSLLILRKRYSVPYNYFLTLLYKFRFTRIIKKEQPDIVFAAAASGEMSQLNIKQPIIYLGDITFNLLKDHYPNYQNLSAFSLWESEKIESKTFRKAAALVFSSQWAAGSAKKDYGVPAEKINIISYGANMDQIPDTQTAIQKSQKGPWHFLFLGMDWVRKGGEAVFNTFELLQKQGYDVKLTVCGCVPPEKFRNPAMTIIPFLNKNNPEDAQQLFQLLLDAHFLFVPSKSDCTPIVFCEANAFGLPVITTDVGGITSVVENGINGHTLPLESSATDYANTIKPYLEDKALYQQLSENSRSYYEQKLNWDQWGKSMSELINRLVK